MTLTEMDYVRAALLNAYHSGMGLEDLIHASFYAETAQGFDHAVNLLAQTVPVDKQQEAMNL